MNYGGIPANGWVDAAQWHGADRRSAQVDVERLVEQTLELHKRLAARKSQSDRDPYQRQIDTTDREIDKLVHELYGLTDEEIKIVEEGK